MHHPALLISGHGTIAADGVDQFMQLTQTCARMRPDIDVRAGFIELSPPPLGESIAELYNLGHRAIISVPLMLFDAGHAKTDIPASLNMGKEAHEGLSITYGKALGVHHRLIAEMNTQLEAAIPADEREDTAVLLVGRGASDPHANSDLAKVARMLWEGRDWPETEIAFIGITHPRVAPALDKLHTLGYRKIVVLSYFLFTGVLEERIAQHVSDWSEAHSETKVTYAGYFGPTDVIAELMWMRYDETVAGTTYRDCDTCIHRFKTDGFESKLNSPLLPHHHPDDPNTHGHHHGHGHGHDHGHDHGHSHGDDHHHEPAPHAGSHVHTDGHGHGHDHGHDTGHHHHH